VLSRIRRWFGGGKAAAAAAGGGGGGGLVSSPTAAAAFRRRSATSIDLTVSLVHGQVQSSATCFECDSRCCNQQR
jgi:hypothetical protein